MRVYRVVWLLACAALAAGVVGVVLVVPSTGALAGWASGGAVAVALLSSPLAVRVYLRWLASPAGGAGTQLDAMVRAFACAGGGFGPVPSAMDLRMFSDEQLCRAWRTSSAALSEQRPADQRLRLVDERQAYLDELERRHPDGVAAWLASGACLDDDLPSYLTTSGRTAAAIDWDRLIPGQEW